MDSNIKKTEVRNWRDEALKTLEQAQKLCTAAQSSLEATSYHVSARLPHMLEYASILFNSLKEQHEYSNRIVSLIKKEYNGLFLPIQEKFKERLDPSLKQLEDILLQLKATAVPSSLIAGKKEEKEDLNLQDFISLDAIDILKENISTYRLNSTTLQHLIESNFNDNVFEPHLARIKRYNKVAQLYNESSSISIDMRHITGNSPFNPNSLLSTVLKENSSLENELVSILEMVTNHYDQCAYALQLFKTERTIESNLEVLQNDALELPEVLKELNTIHEIILNNESRLQKYVQPKINSIDKVITMMEGELEFHRNFKTKVVPKFIILLKLCKEVMAESPMKPSQDPNMNPIESFIETVEQLSYHYSHFLSIYKSKYLEELYRQQYIYPRSFLKKLSNFLNKELYELQEEERQRRKAWIVKYGDFIPKQFRLLGENNQPVVVQVITEGLDELQQEENPFNDSSKEKDLMTLIQKLKE